MADRPKIAECAAIILLAIPGAFIGAVALGYAFEILMEMD